MRPADTFGRFGFHETSLNSAPAQKPVRRRGVLLEMRMVQWEIQEASFRDVDVWAVHKEGDKENAIALCATPNQALRVANALSRERDAMSFLSEDA